MPPKMKRGSYHNAFKKEVTKRLAARRDVVIAVIGPQGSGKTVCAYAIGHHLEPTFDQTNFKQHTAFGNSQQFAERLQDDCKLGMPLIFDELGAGAAAMDYMTEAAKAFTSITMVKRYKQRIIINCLPSIKDTLKSFTRSIDFIFEVKERNDGGNWYYCMLSAVVPDRFRGKDMRTRPRFKVKRDTIETDFGVVPQKPKVTKFTGIYVKGISKEWRDEIATFNNVQKDRILQAGGGRALQSLSNDAQIENAFNAVRANPTKYERSYGGRKTLNRALLMGEFGLRSNVTFDRLRGKLEMADEKDGEGV
jgi:hypothetical protein